MTEDGKMYPRRIQRLRSAHWRMPENSVYVGRPSRWGNPFRITTPNGRDKVLTEFHEYAERRYLADPEWVDGLIDKNLVCWCALTEPCHADFLLELAQRRKRELSKITEMIAHTAEREQW